MKQINMFGQEYAPNQEDSKYSLKIETPIYEPKNQKPHVMSLYDKLKTDRLINEINNSQVSDEDKKFLIEAAKRHTVFNYERIADYYANSSKEVQNLMEKSALVIIDFEKAIQLGYVRLCDEIKTQYLEEYGE
jgi:hypothetical protein